MCVAQVKLWRRGFPGAGVGSSRECGLAFWAGLSPQVSLRLCVYIYMPTLAARQVGVVRFYLMRVSKKHFQICISTYDPWARIWNIVRHTPLIRCPAVAAPRTLMTGGVRWSLMPPGWEEHNGGLLTHTTGPFRFRPGMRWHRPRPAGLQRLRTCRVKVGCNVPYEIACDGWLGFGLPILFWELRH
jgi:hypothetical protein